MDRCGALENDLFVFANPLNIEYCSPAARIITLPIAPEIDRFISNLQKAMY